MRRDAHWPGAHRCDDDAAAARGVCDRSRHHHGPRGKEMRLALAALVFTLLPAATPAQALRSLFFTQQQRAILDMRRNARLPHKPSAPTAAAPATPREGYATRP